MSRQVIGAFSKKLLAFTKMPKKTHAETAGNLGWQEKRQETSRIISLALRFSIVMRCAFRLLCTKKERLVTNLK
jgi:hypothetical protein